MTTPCSKGPGEFQLPVVTDWGSFDSVVNDGGESIFEYKYLCKYQAKLDFLVVLTRVLWQNNFYIQLKKSICWTVHGHKILTSVFFHQSASPSPSALIMGWKHIRKKRHKGRQMSSLLFWLILHSISVNKYWRPEQIVATKQIVATGQIVTASCDRNWMEKQPRKEWQHLPSLMSLFSYMGQGFEPQH